MGKGKFFNILLKVPRGWMPLINTAVKKSGVSRNEWLRTVIRDSLIDEGVWLRRERNAFPPAFPLSRTDESSVVYDSHNIGCSWVCDVHNPIGSEEDKKEEKKKKNLKSYILYDSYNRSSKRASFVIHGV